MNAGLKTSLARSSIIFGIGHAVPAGLAFLLITISAFYLSPEQLGIIGLAEATAIVVAHIAIMALPTALRRLFFGDLSDARRRLLVSSILRGGLLIASAGIVISLLLGPLIFNVAPTDLPDFYPYFAYAIGYQVLYQLLEYRLTLYQVNRRPVAYAILHGVTGFAIFVFAIFFVVVVGAGASGFLLGRMLAVSLVVTFVIYEMRSYFLQGWSGHQFNSALKYSAPLVPHLLAMTILNFADRFLLEVYSTTAEVGLYTLAYTLGLAMYLVTVAFSMAWGPFFFQAVNEGEERRHEITDLAGKAVVAAAAIAIFGTMISRDFVTMVFSEDYHPAAPIVPLIIAGYLLFFLYSMFSYSLLHNKKTLYIAPVTVLTAIANIVLNIWLIPNYGMAGAAWATILSFGLQTLLIYVIAVYSLSVRYPIGKAILALGIFSVVLVLSQFEDIGGYFFYAASFLAILAVLGLSVSPVSRLSGTR